MGCVLLSGLGSPGDIHPFIAIGLALKKEGLTPRFLANPDDIPRIEAHGIDTIPVGPPLHLMSRVSSDPKYLLSPQAGVYTTKDIFIPFSRDLYPAAAAAIDTHTPVAVISHPFCFGAIWAAKTAGIPTVVAHLAPLSLMTRDIFSAYPVVKRALYSLAIPLGKAQLAKLVKPLCDELGVPWHRDILEETMISTDHLVGMWSPAFYDPSPPTAGGRWQTCGFPTLPARPAPSDESLEAFLAKGDPPVAITLGTNAFAFAGDFFEHALTAAKRLGFRPLVICKEASNLRLPTGAIAVNQADYSRVFPACRAVIHHGGIGVTAATLKAGSPAVVVPFGHDQEDNGLRVERLGAGRLVPRAKAERLLRPALAEILLDETASRAKSVGQVIREETDGATALANHVKTWLEHKGHTATA